MAQTFDGSELLMGITCPPLPPILERQRRQPLDVSAPETFDAWLRENGGRTLEEFARTERGEFKPEPPPAPPRRKDDEGRLLPLGEGMKWQPHKVTP